MEQAVGDSPAIKDLISRMLKLHPRLIDLSLSRIERLLKKLGDPHKKLPPVIHVAGTNGKGSVTALTRSMLEAAGYRVHCYTSPHLVRFGERIRVAGKLIDDDDLIRILEHCEKVNEGDEITFFEFVTAAAFHAFAETPADVAIIEVGLGGRLDATNVIEKPLVSAITPIHLDHQSYLGRTLSQIAGEKAGIIKPGVPAVISPQPVAVQTILSEAAKKVKAPLLAHGRDWHISAADAQAGQMYYKDDRGSMLLPLPSLYGAHQIKNAGQAIAILRNQSVFKVPEAAIKAGLDWARWPARLQPLEVPEWEAQLPEGAEIWLDGGHNPAAARTLMAFFREVDGDEVPFYLIIGMLTGKDAHRFLKAFQPIATGVYGVPLQDRQRGRKPSELAAEAVALKMKGKKAESVAAAIRDIGKSADPDKPPVILIAGSLYLAGDVLKAINQLPR